MLQVKPISREVIDAWPISNSGLPVRIVNGVAPSNVRKVGDLRSWSDQDLLALRSLGRISLQHIKKFFKLCEQIEQGKQTFQNIQEVFAIFLDEAELNVVSARYGFDRKDPAVSRNYKTLQQIGNTENKTRERIRQIQETAVQTLKSHLATTCLQPFNDCFLSYIENLGHVANCADLAPLQDDPALGGYSICSILLLLSDLAPSKITFYRDFFSTLPIESLRLIEQKALDRLNQAQTTVGLEQILTEIPDVPGIMTAETKRKATAYVMDHCPAAAATLDHRYFLYTTGTQGFLVEVLAKMERPVHYRTITNLFNEQLKPRSRKGAGFILEMLNTNPKCTRVDRGVYDLKAP